MANSGDGYAYIYENVSANPLNSADGYSYTYENVGANPTNSNDGYAYTYINVLLYVIYNAESMPPIIN